MKLVEAGGGGVADTFQWAYSMPKFSDKLNKTSFIHLPKILPFSNHITLIFEVKM